MERTLKGSLNWEHEKAKGQLEEVDVHISKVIGYCPKKRIGNIPKEERHTMVG